MKRSIRLPLHPKHPERTCWGCDKYCPANDLTCGNGTERQQHPVELFGEDWYEWSHAARDAEDSDAAGSDERNPTAVEFVPRRAVEPLEREGPPSSPPRG